MKKKRLAFAFLPLLLAGPLMLIPALIPMAYAASLTGLVCLADPATAPPPPANPCPPTPPTLTGPKPTSPPTQLKIGVFVNGSGPINGFDITLNATHAILLPSGVDLTGTVLPGGTGGSSVTVECIGGVKIKGPTCSATDTVDTIHFAALGAAGGLTFPPTTGLLFTAIYNITGTTTRTPIGFQKGCQGTSVAPDVCITLTSTGGPSPETAEKAGFSNLPYFALDASTATLIISKGAPPDSTTTITATSLNKFNGTVTLTANVVPPGPTAAVGPPPNLKVTAANPVNFTGLTITVASSVSPGSYNVTVTGISAPLPANSVSLQVIVPVPDFAISANPTSSVSNVSSTVKSIVTLVSVANFAADVNLTISAPPSLTASIAPIKVTLSAGGSATSTLTATSAIPGNYIVNVTGTSGSTSHRVGVTITVVDFGLSTSPSLVSVLKGSSQGVSLTVSAAPDSYPCCFSGDVTLKLSVTTSTGVPTTGLTASCSTLTLHIDQANSQKTTSCSFTGNTIGSYTVVIMGISGPFIHPAVVQATVTGPDFAISASPNSQTIQAGSAVNSTITVNSMARFNGTITLSTSSTPGGPVMKLTATQVTLNTATTTTTSILTIAANFTIPAGTYTVTVTGTNGSVIHSAAVILTVIVAVNPHQIGVYSVTVDKTNAQVGDKVTFTIEVQNLGTVQEQVTVAALVGDLTVAQQNVTIPAGKNVNVTLVWDTSGYTAGTYVFGAKAIAVPGQTSFGNNTMRSSAALTLTAPPQGLLSTTLSLIVPIVVVVVAAIGLVIGITLIRARRKSAV